MSPRAIVLAAGAFAVGTSAYLVAGVLPEISAELGVSVTAAGQLATAFNLAYAVGAPIVATVAGRWDRRTLLVAALLTAAVGNAVAAFATTYPVLFAGRIIAALGAAAYTPAATMVATTFYPPEHRGRAVALVFGGLTAALALGVPLGTVLGGPLGYRGVFGLVAVAGLVAALGVRTLVPAVAAPPHVALRERLAVAANRDVLGILAVTVVGVLAVMSVYTYVVPLLGAVTGITGLAVSVLLLCYGAGAILGNAIGGRATDRFGSRPTLLVTMGGLVVMLSTLPLTLATVATAVAALFVWSLFTWAFNPPFQNLLLDVAGDQGALALSLNASAIYLGAGLSGIVGGLVVAGPGVVVLPLVGGGLAVLAAVLFLTVGRARRPAPACVPVG